MISQCLHLNPSQRIKLEDILSHPWMRKDLSQESRNKASFPPFNCRCPPTMGGHGGGPTAVAGGGLVACSLPASASNLSMPCCNNSQGLGKPNRKHIHHQNQWQQMPSHTYPKPTVAGENKPSLNSVGSMMSAASSTDDYSHSSPQKNSHFAGSHVPEGGMACIPQDILFKHPQSLPLQGPMGPPQGPRGFQQFQSSLRPVITHSAPQHHVASVKHHPLSAPSTPTEQLSSLPPLEGLNMVIHHQQHPATMA